MGVFIQIKIVACLEPEHTPTHTHKEKQAFTVAKMGFDVFNQLRSDSAALTRCTSEVMMGSDQPATGN